MEETAVSEATTTPAPEAEPEAPNLIGVPSNANLDAFLDAVRKGKLTDDEARKQLTFFGARAAAGILEAQAFNGGLRVPLPKPGALPDWAPIPAKGVVQPKGRPMYTLRFPSVWTALPSKGVRMPDHDGLWRWCVVWELTDTEELAALQRGQGNSQRNVSELAKQMIRVVDGHPANWAAAREAHDSPEQWWTEIGKKCQGMMLAIYNQLHTLGAAEMSLFFTSFIEGKYTG